jgi:AcrR family transcriptional regulator
VSESRGEATRRRILDATVATLRTEGIAGTSARSIARRGGFAPGVLFYHYADLQDVLVAAVRRMSHERVEQYRPDLEAAQDLRDLVRVGRSIHERDCAEGHSTVLTQMLAATSGNPDLGPVLHEIFTPWLELIAETVTRILADSPVADLVPPEQLSYAVTAMFLGLQLLDDLEPSADRAAQLLDVLEEGAEVGGALLALLRFGA